MDHPVFESIEVLFPLFQQLEQGYFLLAFARFEQVGDDERSPTPNDKTIPDQSRQSRRFSDSCQPSRNIEIAPIQSSIVNQIEVSLSENLNLVKDIFLA